MMEEITGEKDSWEVLGGLIAHGHLSDIQFFMEGIPSKERARAISRLNEEEHIRLLEILGPTIAADILDDLPDAQAADLLEEVKPAAAAAIIEELDSDDRADILGDMDEEATELILEKMAPEEAEEAREMMEFADDSAGGIMIKEYLAYPAHVTLLDIQNDLRENAEKYKNYLVQYIYIIDENESFIGLIRLRDMVLNSGQRKAADIAIKDPICVATDTPIEELQSFFDEFPYLGVPVIDAENKLTGVVIRADVEEAAEEKAQDSFLKSAGIVGGEELRSMPLTKRAFRRLGWLSPNLVLNLISASIIAIYQDTLEAAIALAVFLPIISDMSGCSGNQAVAVSIRELSMGFIEPKEIKRVLFKEVFVGLINGFILGLLLSTVAAIYGGNLYLGLIVGLALFLNTVIAVCLGGLLPLVLKRLKKDPALASGPILTTVTDMCGFFIVLSLASQILSKLA